MNSEQPQWHKEGTQPHEIRNAERREIDALPAGTTAGAARALRALAIGAVAFGALALGALAIGRLAVGFLAIGRSRIRRLEIEELDVKRLRVSELEIVDGNARAAQGGTSMDISRVVPDIQSEHLDESREFYVGLLGFTVVLDMGWIMTFASPTHPTAQLTVLRHDASSQLVPQVTVQVADVDAIHAEAVRRGVPVVYPLTDEPWGVRRFFVRDPNDVVLNIMCHRPSAAAS